MKLYIIICNIAISFASVSPYTIIVSNNSITDYNNNNCLHTYYVPSYGITVYYNHSWNSSNITINNETSCCITTEKSQTCCKDYANEVTFIYEKFVLCDNKIEFRTGAGDCGSMQCISGEITQCIDCDEDKSSDTKIYFNNSLKYLILLCIVLYF